MKQKTITIVTVGSRGDVQPYIALGLGLEGAGYGVRIAAPATLSGLITSYGLMALPIHAVDPRAFLGSAAVQDAAEQGNPLLQMRRLLHEARPLIAGFLEEVWEACQGSDAVIATAIPYGAQDGAEKLGIPCIYTFLHPLFPTSSFPSPLAPRLLGNLGSLNRATHRLVEGLIWQAFRPAVKTFRKRLGLPPAPFWNSHRLMQQRTSLVLFGFSPAVVRKPKDWPEHAHVTGYWFLDELEGWRPPANLETFLNSGPPPLYIGFGSMSDRTAEGMTQLLVNAVTHVEQRAVFVTGWGGFGNVELPDTVFRLESAPHAWLFPRMAAVMHHGGAGTTAAGFRAGVPSIITPFLADQPFWAGRAFALGVGPEPVAYRRLTVEALEARFRRVLEDERMRERAKGLGQSIQAEDGVGNCR